MWERRERGGPVAIGSAALLLAAMVVLTSCESDDSSENQQTGACSEIFERRADEPASGEGTEEDPYIYPYPQTTDCAQFTVEHDPAAEGSFIRIAGVPAGYWDIGAEVEFDASAATGEGGSLYYNSNGSGLVDCQLTDAAPLLLEKPDGADTLTQTAAGAFRLIRRSDILLVVSGVGADTVFTELAITFSPDGRTDDERDAAGAAGPGESACSGDDSAPNTVVLDTPEMGGMGSVAMPYSYMVPADPDPDGDGSYILLLTHSLLISMGTEGTTNNQYIEIPNLPAGTWLISALVEFADSAMDGASGVIGYNDDGSAVTEAALMPATITTDQSIQFTYPADAALETSKIGSQFDLAAEGSISFGIKNAAAAFKNVVIGLAKQAPDSTPAPMTPNTIAVDTPETGGTGESGMPYEYMVPADPDGDGRYILELDHDADTLTGVDATTASQYLQISGLAAGTWSVAVEVAYDTATADGAGGSFRYNSDGATLGTTTADFDAAAVQLTFARDGGEASEALTGATDITLAAGADFFIGLSGVATLDTVAITLTQATSMTPMTLPLNTISVSAPETGGMGSSAMPYEYAVTADTDGDNRYILELEHDVDTLTGVDATTGFQYLQISGLAAGTWSVAVEVEYDGATVDGTGGSFRYNSDGATLGTTATDFDAAAVQSTFARDGGEASEALTGATDITLADGDDLFMGLSGVSTLDTVTITLTIN